MNCPSKDAHPLTRTICVAGVLDDAGSERSSYWLSVLEKSLVCLRAAKNVIVT